MHHSLDSRSVRRLAAHLLSGLLAVGLVAAVTTPAHATVHAQGIRVPATFFGLHDGSSASYRHLTYGAIRLWDAQVTWKDVETSPGVYSWTRLDSLVSAAQQHGVEPTLVLAMTPTFYGPSHTLPPTDLSHFADYVGAVMDRYRDFSGSRGIFAYQVWNEGNISTFWTGTPQQLARLTQIVDQVRDQVDPDASVVAPSFAVRLPYQQRWLADYESQVVDGAPVWSHVDANALSLYPKATYDGRIGGPEDAMTLLTQARQRLADAGVPASLPIEASEINYGVGSNPDGPVAATPISEKRQVANVLRTYLLGAAHGLSQVFWYRYDWNVVPAIDGTLGNTLLSTPGVWDEVTPAGEAVDTAQQWLDGRLVGVDGHRPCAKDARSTYTCQVTYAGGTRTIVWNPTHNVSVDVHGAAYTQRADGARTTITTKVASVRVGYQPVLVVTSK